MDIFFDSYIKVDHILSKYILISVVPSRKVLRCFWGGGGGGCHQDGVTDLCSHIPNFQ